VLARLAEPDLYNSVRGTVAVSATGPHQVLLQVDAEGFLDWVWERLSAAGVWRSGPRA
jgi:hypothetical protein